MKILGSISALVLIAACAKADPAPSLSALSKRDGVAPAMKRMATAMVEIHLALNTSTVGPEDHDKVVRWLDEMQDAAESLEGGPETRHEKLDEHLDAFLRYLDEARRAISEDVPNYYLLGAVSGSCMSCHSRAAPSQYTAGLLR